MDKIQNNQNVTLYKKKHYYTNSDGKQAWNWNFLIDTGTRKIAVAPVKFGEKDNFFQVRKVLLAEAAVELVDDVVEQQPQE